MLQAEPSIHKPNAFRWEIRDEWRALEPALLQWQEKTRPLRGDRVRSTERIEWQGTAIGIKLFRRSVLPRRGLKLLLPTPARREFQILRMLRSRGMNVVEPLALGSSTSVAACECVVYLWKDDTTDLQNLLSRLSDRETRHLSASVARQVRTMHDLGVQHRDLHAGNVWVGKDGGVILADFHRARMRRRLTARQRLDDLLAFSHFFHRRARPIDKLRFLKAYGGDFWPLGKRLRRQVLRRVQGAADRSMHAFLRHHEKRCLGGGREFRAFRRAGFFGVAIRGCEQRLIDRLLLDPRAIQESECVLVHRGESSAVWRWRPSASTQEIAIKHYRDSGILGWCKARLRGSRARRAWLNLFRLHSIGITTPEPLFFAQATGLGARDGFLVYRFVPEGSMLARLKKDTEELPPALSSAVRDVALLHDHFLCHRDLKAENLLVVPSQGRLLWVDFDGIRRARRIDVDRVVKDLMRLNASFDLERLPLRSRWRYLDEYLRSRRGPVLARDDLARAICRKTAEKWKTTAPSRRSDSC